MIAAWLNLEVASGNDAISSHSAIRKTAKLMGQFLPGTDFVTSGYSVMPRRDNTFGGGNYDADDLDLAHHPARLAGRRRHRARHGGRGDAGAAPRIVRVRRNADVAFIAHDGARLSGSGIALGIQSKGTAVIHRVDLQPLDNLELFGMSPLYSVESYRAMGRNAAGYALGKRVGPVPTELDNFARAKLRTTVLHARETQAVVPGAALVELALAPTAGLARAVSRARPAPPRSPRGTAA